MPADQVVFGFQEVARAAAYLCRGTPLKLISLTRWMWGGRRGAWNLAGALACHR